MLTRTTPLLLRYFSGVLLVGLIALPVQAKINIELTCGGPSVAGWIAVQGLRQSLPYTPLGDAQVWFDGTLTGDFGQLQVHYEGYTPLPHSMVFWWHLSSLC